MTTPDGPTEEGPGEQVPVARPRSVENSFLFWLAVAGLGVVVLVLSVTIGGDDPSAVAGGVLFIALYLFFVFMMRAGKDWARITLSLVGLLGIVGVLLQLRGIGIVGMLLNVLQLLLILLAGYFMFRPDANQFFTASKARG